jgi:hypothetical protein
VDYDIPISPNQLLPILLFHGYFLYKIIKYSQEHSSATPSNKGSLQFAQLRQQPIHPMHGPTK